MIQSIDTLDFLGYSIDYNKHRFIIGSDNDDVFDYINLIVDILERFDLATMAVYEETTGGSFMFECYPFWQMKAN